MSRIDATTKTDCGGAGLSGEALERHLFLCEECRGGMRLSAAWEALKGERAEGELPPAGDAFHARVRAAIARDASRRRRRRWLLAAAAVLLFFFAAGANSRDRTAPSPSAEEDYASLSSPSSTLEGLLPE
jgi:hypothetical protein